MDSTPLICIVEDEVELAHLMVDYLSANHFHTQVFHRGDEADLWLQQHQPDLVLLDLMLPGMDGLSLCKNLRQHSAVPVIMMTAKVEEIDRLLGLELGADDYVCKPFSAREVVARIKAVLRRTLPTSTEPAQQPLVRVDEQSMSVYLQEAAVELTTIEFQLFALLYAQPGRIFSRQYIMDNIYQDYRIVSDRTVDGHIKKLRKKLAAANADMDLIRSVYGSGYKFDSP